MCIACLVMYLLFIILSRRVGALDSLETSIIITD